MAVLNLRNFPDDTKKRLRIEAATRGISIEALAAELVAQALDSKKTSAAK